MRRVIADRHTPSHSRPPTGTAGADLLELELAVPSSSGAAPSEALPPGSGAVATGHAAAGPADATARPVIGSASGQHTPRVGRPHPESPEGGAPDDPFAGSATATRLPGSSGEHLLQNAYSTDKRARKFYDDQVLDHLNESMREFISRMDLAFVATSDAHGECDSSLRAGTPGFIEVLDDRHLAYPEYRGNGVMASLGNISENPHVGILLVDFVTDLIGLHVNGKARILEDSDLRAIHPELPADFEHGKRPERWVVVQVEEAYIHCRKHIPRFEPAPRQRTWGTDDVKRKGGDYFGARGTPRPWHETV